MLTKFTEAEVPIVGAVRPVLFYNSWHPVHILKEQIVRTSILDGHDRGLSMSENPGEYGHGAFKFVFRPDRAWYHQFLPCIYSDKTGPEEWNRLGVPPFLLKKRMFECEKEWWSPTAVNFELKDVDRVVFMLNSPASRIHPIIVKRRWREAVELFSSVVRFQTDETRYPPPREEEWKET